MKRDTQTTGKLCAWGDGKPAVGEIVAVHGRARGVSIGGVYNARIDLPSIAAVCADHARTLRPMPDPRVVAVRAERAASEWKGRQLELGGDWPVRP
jgi:hypothetical protein